MTPITKEWAKSLTEDFELRYHETSNYDWIATFPWIKVRGLGKNIFIFLSTGGVSTQLEHIKYTEEIEQLVLLLTGKTLKQIYENTKSENTNLG
jgi:hypothetical protein